MNLAAIVTGSGRLTRRAALVAGAFALAACDPGAFNIAGPGGGQVQVGMLLPSGASDPLVQLLAQDLADAARLRAGEAGGRVEIRFYDTGATAGGAAEAARQAAADGAQVILGPLYAQSANGAGLAASEAGLSVLSFSNNPAVAGGNVFILGSTFQDSANRLVGYARGQGRSRMMVVSGRSPGEASGRAALISAIQASGAQLVGDETFELSQEGVTAAAPGIAAAAEAAGADTIFMTSGPDGALSFLVQLLPEAGLSSEQVQYAGLTRWDVPSSALALPGLQGGWFVLPDPASANSFASRFSQAYGKAPHPLAGLAYDGVATIAAASGGSGPIPTSALVGTSVRGASGAVQLLPNGTNQRALAIATVANNTVQVIDAAPASLGGAGF